MAPFAYISDIFSSDICESHSESSESTVITALLSYSSLIMSQSQASGSQYEASHYANSFIDPELLQSDDFTDTLGSETPSSTHFSDFPIPPRYHHAPDSLERVGKPLQQHYILYNSDSTNPKMGESRREFVEWWLKTEYGQKQDIQRSIRWDSNLKKSDVWSSFDQVAHAKTGEPKVMCKRCQNVIIHPAHRRAGCSPMKTHLASAVCIKPQTSKSKRQGIDQLLRDLVSLYL